MNFSDCINFVISGEAGQGIETADEIITHLLHWAGFHVFSSSEYMSRVRGGCNSVFVKVSKEKLPYFSDRIDVLLMLDEKALEHLKNNITQETVIVDAQKKNVYAIGYITKLFGVDDEKALEYLKSKFPKIFESNDNVAAFENGQKDAQNEILKSNIKIEIPRDETLNQEKIFSGNEAFAIGAIAGGANFLAFYPMSPSTNFSEFLIQNSDDFNIIVQQVEDEICAINMSIGASYAGAKSCVSTSGGGFALMCEGLSLAGMLETPLVIHLAQRPAPATGLPTRTAQEDLNLALYSGHGEFPRIILSPATLEDSFSIGMKSFDLAQKYQVPVFVLTEKSFLECDYSAKPFEIENKEQKDYFIASAPDYVRYKLSDNPVSPMALPNYGEGIVCVDSDEHDEIGYITEDFEIRKLMVEKRLKKLDLIKQDIIEPYFIGNDNYENLIISWGSNFNVIKGAIKDREKFALLHYTQIYPLADFSLIENYIKKSAKLIVAEQNATAQFAGLLKREYGLIFDHKLLKYNGMPFSIEEISRFLDEI